MEGNIMKKPYAITVLLLIQTLLITAQDIHFSQFYQTPLITNPALTGVFNGDMRVIINYKDQWRSISTPYKTYALSYDMPLFKKKWDNSFLGTGFYAFNDKAGDAGMSKTQFNLTLSYIYLLDKHNTLTAGLLGGYAQRSVDPSNLEWESQFNVNTGAFDPAMPTGETNSFSPVSFADFAGGVSWGFVKGDVNMSSNDHFRANMGLALFHINQPKQELYSLETDNLYSKLVVHAGMNIGIKHTTTSLLPSVLYLNQGPTKEINFGLMARHRLKEESKYTQLVKESAILFGLYYRFRDALIPTIMYEKANFSIGISYDINISNLKLASSGRGGIEISFRYVSPNPFRYGQGKKYTPMI